MILAGTHLFLYGTTITTTILAVLTLPRPRRRRAWRRRFLKLLAALLTASLLLAADQGKESQMTTTPYGVTGTINVAAARSRSRAASCTSPP